MYAKPASSKEHQHKSKSRSFKTLMIGNVSDLQEATQSEVVVGGGLGTTVLEFLVAAPFAIHVAIQ
jgi:hypothetical protein